MDGHFNTFLSEDDEQKGDGLDIDAKIKLTIYKVKLSLESSLSPKLVQGRHLFCALSQEGAARSNFPGGRAAGRAVPQSGSVRSSFSGSRATGPCCRVAL